MPDGIDGAGPKMTLGMTIPATGIAFSELIPMRILMATFTMTGLPRIVGTAGINVAFGIRLIWCMARCAGQAAVRTL